jgi:hypothetical protein
MANYQGNPLGGIKLPGPEQQIAAGSFQTLTGGMGLDTLLGGTGGNVPLLPSAATDPVLSGLAFAGGGNPLAALMGGGSGGDPAALLASLLGSGIGAEMAEPPAPDLKAEMKRVAVKALSDPEFASMLLEDPAVLQRVVKLLATTGAGGGNAVG